MNTVIDSSLWFCFLPHRILVSLTVAPESSLRRRCFFPAVKSTTWLYESSDRRRVSLRAFIVTELFCVPRAFVYPVPFLLLFKDFSSTFCEIDSGDCLFSIKLIVPGKCFFFFFKLIFFPLPFCWSFFFYVFYVSYLHFVSYSSNLSRIHTITNVVYSSNGTSKIKISSISQFWHVIRSWTDVYVFEIPLCNWYMRSSNMNFSISIYTTVIY